MKSPLVYTNALVRNWRAFERLGVGYVHSPGRWHTMLLIDFPVSLGSVQYPDSPDEPIVLHMAYTPTHPGLPPREQARKGRYRLLATSFEEYEREVRSHLAGMLGSAGFDPAEDLLGLTVNRWPHGYAWERNPLFDPEYAPGEAPNEIGRRRHGRIAIANSDAGASAYLDSAIDRAGVRSRNSADTSAHRPSGESRERPHCWWLSDSSRRVRRVAGARLASQGLDGAVREQRSRAAPRSSAEGSVERYGAVRIAPEGRARGCFVRDELDAVRFE